MSDGIRNLHRPSRARVQLLAVACTLITMAGTGAVRAADDDDSLDDRGFERKLLDNIMGGFGVRRDGDSSIEYRERSPLVVPPTTELPPPETTSRANASNWPKDPDVRRRKAEAAARKKNGPETEDDRLNPIRPSELNKGGRAASAAAESRGTPDTQNPDPLSPSQLGYKGGLFSNLFGSVGKEESAKFDGEPARGSLVQPPPGYQTPASSYTYGPGRSTVDAATKAREIEQRQQSGDPSAK